MTPAQAWVNNSFPVEVKGGVCLSGSTPAGSVLTMDKAVANVEQFTGSSLATAVRMASWNPAQMLGMPHLASLTAGHPANFNLYDDTGEHTGSIVRGQFLPSR